MKSFNTKQTQNSLNHNNEMFECQKKRIRSLTFKNDVTYLTGNDEDSYIDRNADRNVDRNADRNVDRNVDRNADRNVNRNVDRTTPGNEVQSRFIIINLPDGKGLSNEIDQNIIHINNNNNTMD